MPQDILLDENFDLQTADGDFVVNDSTTQHQRILIFADKGEFKQFPLAGVGAKRFLENSRPDAFAREVRLQFINDGMSVRQIFIADDLEINVDADYDS